MKVFQTNFLRLVVLLLPTMLRRPAIIALLQGLVKPVISLQNRFNDSREANVYDVAHTGQVCHIKSVLNNYFELNYANGFEIEDVVTPGEWLMTYDEPGNIGEIPIIDDEQAYFIANDEASTGSVAEATGDEPGNTYEVILIGSREASAFLWDERIILAYTYTFIVFVPVEIFTNLALMPIVRTLVNKYRLVSRLPEYKIKL